MSKELKLTFDKDGSMSCDAVGFAGDQCTKASGFLDKIFATIKTTKKGDAYRKDVVKCIKH